MGLCPSQHMWSTGSVEEVADALQEQPQCLKQAIARLSQLQANRSNLIRPTIWDLFAGKQGLDAVARWFSTKVVVPIASRMHGIHFGHTNGFGWCGPYKKTANCLFQSKHDLLFFCVLFSKMHTTTTTTRDKRETQLLGMNRSKKSLSLGVVFSPRMKFPDQLEQHIQALQTHLRNKYGNVLGDFVRVIRVLPGTECNTVDALVCMVYPSSPAQDTWYQDWKWDELPASLPKFMIRVRPVSPPLMHPLLLSPQVYSEWKEQQHVDVDRIQAWEFDAQGFVSTPTSHLVEWFLERFAAPLPALSVRVVCDSYLSYDTIRTCVETIRRQYPEQETKGKETPNVAVVFVATHKGHVDWKGDVEYHLTHACRTILVLVPEDDIAMAPFAPERISWLRTKFVFDICVFRPETTSLYLLQQLEEASRRYALFHSPKRLNVCYVVPADDSKTQEAVQSFLKNIATATFPIVNVLDVSQEPPQCVRPKDVLVLFGPVARVWKTFEHEQKITVVFSSSSSSSSSSDSRSSSVLVHHYEPVHALNRTLSMSLQDLLEWSDSTSLLKKTIFDCVDASFAKENFQ